MESHSNFPWALVFNFLVLVVGGVLLLKKNVSHGLLERHDTLKAKIAEAESLRISAEKLLSDNEAKVKNLDQEIMTIVQDAKQSAEKEKALILARAEDSAAKIIAQSKVLAEQHLLGLQKNIKKDLSGQAIEEARKRLSTLHSEETHEAFFNSFFESSQVTRG